MGIDIGHNIKSARNAAGLTQEELARQCGVATITIRQYESGKREPRIEQLQAIADALNVHVAELMGYVFLGKTDDGLDFYGPSHQKARVDAAVNQMTEEGREKVADYAEDILPRYRAETTPQSTPSPQVGEDTTPLPDVAETPPEGE